MAIIKINLLGKKKRKLPFGIDELLEKTGIKLDDLVSLKIPALKIAIILLGLYLADFVPNYILETQIAELDVKLSALTQKTDALQKELSAKREIRKQMEQLTKEESELQRQLNIISSLSKNRSNAFKTLDTLGLVLPPKVWINRIEYIDNKLQLDGESWEYFPINDFVKILNETVQFQAVTLRRITAAQQVDKPISGIPLAAQKIKNFQIEMLLRDKI